MTETLSTTSGVEQSKPTGSPAPLIFISHDSRDAELAEALSKLLKSVSAGMIKTFRSSDKKAGEGIDFGEEWYRRLMERLESTSDVICLFTERSLERPWILFEAGVAKGKMNTPVIGVALGVPLSRVSTGPFYQFHNMNAGLEELTKLIEQLARRVPGVELDPDVVRQQIEAFKTSAESILKKLTADTAKKSESNEVDDSPFATLIEEMKTLPSRIVERLGESGSLSSKRRPRRIHPMLFEEFMHFADDPGDPISILMAASLVRDDIPWLYELATEVYRAMKSGDPEAIDREIDHLRKFSKNMMRTPFVEELGFAGKDTHMFAMEFPRMLERALRFRREAHPPDSILATQLSTPRKA